MSNKIEMLSPKKEIMDHFDSLINRVDIDIDQCLEKYNQEQVLSELNRFKNGKRNVRGQKNIYLNQLSEEKYIQYETVDEWPESTKVVDYLNRIRMRTIDELRKAQEETLEYYKQNSSQFKLNSIDEIRSELFKDKFHFQVLYKPEDPKYTNSWVFNLFTFDFYLSSTDIDLLEKLINSSPDKYSQLVLDEKMVLIGLLQKNFFNNLKSQKFPTHVIIVSKEDLLNIKDIKCFFLKEVNLSASKSIDLCNLETLEIDGIYETPEIKSFIEILFLRGDLSYFNLDNLTNLKQLNLYGRIMDDFNDHLFDNLCNQLESIEISCTNLNDICIDKLFYDRNFPYLTTFNICNCFEKIKLEKKFFDGLRMLKKMMIFYVRIVDNDVFSNLIELEELWLSTHYIKFIDKTMFSNLVNLKILSLNGNRIESIEENSFSNLHNLEYLDLSCNKLTSISAKLFVGLDNLKELNLSHNKLVNFDLDIFDNIRKIAEINLYLNPNINKDEILNRFLQSNIKVYFS